jgi:hypothetical protein
MELMWTAIVYAVVAGGALLAAYILFRWVKAGQ